VRLELVSTAPLAARRLVESSGVAVSSLVPGVVWTHNDSGDRPFLYATDARGRDLGRLRVAGARAVDWEDLASGPCFVAPGRCLYIGDTGDNGRRRSSIVVYRLREPAPPRGPSDTLGTTPVLDSFVLRYPDGRHDAEALAVAGDGTLALVTKDRSGPALIFRTDVRGSGDRRVLQRVGPLALRTSTLAGRLVTGAALGRRDSVLAVRTYVSVHFFRWASSGVPAPLGTPSGIPIPVIEPQGEGVAFDGPERLILTSERGERARGVISVIRIRDLTVTPVGDTH
jgi:hypothetical protein